MGQQRAPPSGPLWALRNQVQKLPHAVVSGRGNMGTRSAAALGGESSSHTLRFLIKVVPAHHRRGGRREVNGSWGSVAGSAASHWLGTGDPGPEFNCPAAVQRKRV